MNSQPTSSEREDERRRNALAAREDWQRWDWDGAKPYRDHLRERLKTTDDYLGYLDACHEEGPETFALAVHDVLEFAKQAAFKDVADYIRRQWLAAYPVEVFPEPPKPPAECSRDRISAAMGRHMATKLIEYFEAAANEKDDAGDT